MNDHFNININGNVFQICLIAIDILEIPFQYRFKKILSIFLPKMPLSILMSIFSKSVDLLKIDMAYRYSEHHYLRGGRGVTLSYLFNISWWSCVVQPGSALKEASAHLNGALWNCTEQGVLHISIFVPGCFVGIGTLAQQKERWVPGFAHAGKKQRRGLRMNRE